MNKKNVFSEHSEKLSILVYTKSFLNNNDVLHYFNDANMLKSISIYYMPLLEKTEEKVLCRTGEYVHYKERNGVHLSIEFIDCASVVCFLPNIDYDRTYDELNKAAEEFILHEGVTTGLFDYIVASDIWCCEHCDCINITSYSEAQDILRLFLICKKEYELVDHFHCDEFTYYIYRHKTLFEEFQNFWCETLENRNEYDIDTASALDNRLLLFTICFDNACIESYKKQNNTTSMHLIYHLSYLLLLITGAFDSLAWIINNLYGLGFEIRKRNQIDLINKDFRKAIKERSDMLSQVLTSQEFIDQVEAVRELRDRIVHRNFIDTISGEDKGGRKNYLKIDKYAIDKLYKAGFDKNSVWLTIGDDNLVDILKFLKYLQTVATDIVNRFLKVISTEVYHSSEHYCIWKMLKFPSEPYVL